MAYPINIVGWHLCSGAGKCQDCGQDATVMVSIVDDYWDFNLCNACLNGDRYTIKSDKIGDVFKKLGF